MRGLFGQGRGPRQRTSQGIWGICLAGLTLVAVPVVTQDRIEKARQLAYSSVEEVNTKIALSDEVRVRSLLASLDKVLLVVRKDFALNPGLSLEGLVGRLDDLKVEGELNPRLSIANASGSVVLSSAPEDLRAPSARTILDSESFQAQKAAPDDLLFFGPPERSHVTGKWSVPISRRIKGKDGSFGGILVLAVDPALFSASFEKTSTGTNSTRAIIGLDGFTRIRTNDSQQVYGGDSRKSRLFTELAKSPNGCYTAIAAADGVLRAVCYRSLTPYRLVVLAGTAVDGIEHSINQSASDYILTATGFSALVLLLFAAMTLSNARQSRLQVSQNNYRNLMELLPQMIYQMDGHGKIIWANDRTRQYTGPSPEEQAKGFDWVWTAVHPEDRQRMRNFASSSMQPKSGAQSCEYRQRKFDGSYEWFSAQITRTDDPDGQTYLMQTGTNIQDRKMAEQRALAAQKLETIGQLAGGMAHDFNNLLAIVLGSNSLLKSEVLSEDGTTALAVATSAAQRGVGLVKALLALASRQPLLPARIDLRVLLERISILLIHALGTRIRFQLALSDAVVAVEVDEAGLEAALLNLAVNARDAMPRGGDFCLTLDVANGMAHLSAKDTGAGMPDAVLRRATEPFFTTKESGRGTGLGLAMVAGFAQQSGGSLRIRSAEGIGTTIEILLPLVQADESSLAGTTPAGSADMAAPATIAAPKGSILIVDDEPDLAKLISVWARQAGHQAAVASDAEEAFSMLQDRSFDILITDIVMPGVMDGLALADKASRMQRRLKILLMSGYSLETSENRANIRWPLLVKPFGQAAFNAAVEQHT